MTGWKEIKPKPKPLGYYQSFYYFESTAGDRGFTYYDGNTNKD